MARYYIGPYTVVTRRSNTIVSTEDRTLVSPREIRISAVFDRSSAYEVVNASIGTSDTRINGMRAAAMQTATVTI